MSYKPRIKLVIVTGDSISTSEIKAPHVTAAMFDAAYDLVYTLMTNKRRTTYRATEAAAKQARAALVKTKAKRRVKPRLPGHLTLQCPLDRLAIRP